MARSKKAQENRLRRVLNRHGFALTKKREWAIVPNQENHGLYRVVDVSDGRIIKGKKFDWSLEDIEDWLRGRRPR